MLHHPKKQSPVPSKFANWLDEFLQFETYNLEVATVRTETRVLYDDKYLYIAFNNFDPNPESIMKPVGEYSHVIRSQAKNYLFIAGQSGINIKG